MIFGIANNLNPDAAGQHYFADISCVKDGYGIHVLQCRQDFRTFKGRSAWTALTFQCANAGVRIHTHHNPAPKLLCAVQVAHVTHVQKVKAAVGQNDFLTDCAPLLHTLGKLRERQNFLWGRND
jgi:hypothetical protein